MLLLLLAPSAIVMKQSNKPMKWQPERLCCLRPQKSEPRRCRLKRHAVHFFLWITALTSLGFFHLDVKMSHVICQPLTPFKRNLGNTPPPPQIMCSIYDHYLKKSFSFTMWKKCQCGGLVRRIGSQWEEDDWSTLPEVRPLLHCDLESGKPGAWQGKTHCSVTLKFHSTTEHTVDSKVYSSGDFTLLIKPKTVPREI